MNRTLRVLALAATICVLTALFAVLVFSAFRDSFFTHPIDFGLLILAFFFAQIFSIFLVLRVFTEFARHFYDITSEQAQELVTRLIFGVSGQAFLPLLEIQQGQADLEGPEILHKVGGPGMLRIAHDTAVVTQRLARLQRVIGPGMHTLEPFEKIWDVVDLRPQRRTIKVSFMTRDGIPAHCSADIRFRIAAGHLEPSENNPFPYQEQAVLTVATIKRARDTEGKVPVQDWQQRIANGVLDGVLRNTLERYSLDDFLNPRHPLPREDTGSSNSAFLKELETQIEEDVRRAGYRMGIDVDHVQLGPILSAEGAISQQWLEFWQARLQRIVDERKIEGDAVYTDLLLRAQVNTKIELLTTMLDEVKRLTHEGEDVPTDLLLLSFIDVLSTMTKQGDPLVQERLDTLIRLVRGFV